MRHLILGRERDILGRCDLRVTQRHQIDGNATPPMLGSIDDANESR